MRWETEHVRRLRKELNSSCNKICDALETNDSISGEEEYTSIDGVSIRTSVAGMRAILNEINKLK